MGVFDYFRFENRLQRRKARMIERHEQYLRDAPMIEAERRRKRKEEDRITTAEMRELERMMPVLEKVDLTPVMMFAQAMNNNVSRMQQEVPEMLDREQPGWRRIYDLDYRLAQWEREERENHLRRGDGTGGGGS